jgi:hypothetical protein
MTAYAGDNSIPPFTGTSVFVTVAVDEVTGVFVL